CRQHAQHCQYQQLERQIPDPQGAAGMGRTGTPATSGAVAVARLLLARLPFPTLGGRLAANRRTVQGQPGVAHVLCPWPALGIGAWHIEHGIANLRAAVAAHRGNMYEQLLASAFGLDEAEALGVVPALQGATLFHVVLSAPARCSSRSG